jgi:hypothetical protein
MDSSTRTLRWDTSWSETGDITILGKDKGECFSSMKIMTRQEIFKWEVINVYGPVQVERKIAFLEELSQKITSLEDPFIIGEDSNMIRLSVF